MSPKTASSMRGIAALALFCAAATAPAVGQEPTQPQQKEHTVRKGDTLWDLAGFYLSDPFRWPMIYNANRQVVENPHWIYPKERLVIPGLPADSAAPVMVADAGPLPVQRSRFYREPVHLEPTGPTLIEGETEDIRLVQPLEWLAAPWITDSGKQPAVNARVWKAADPRIETDKLTPFFHPHDQLFLSTVGKGVKKDDRLLAVRFERDLTGFGWLVVPKGVLRVDSIAPGSATATILNQFDDLTLGDVTIPLPAVPAMPTNKMTDVSGGPTGKVIDFLLHHSLYGNAEYAFVNLGAAKGIAVGDQLLAYLPQNKPTGREKMTEQAVADLRVIRVMNGTATVRVIGMSNAVLNEGVPVRVTRKAP